MTEMYDSFIRELQKLPDFNRLPLPDSVRERLDIPVEYHYMGIKEAVSRTLDNTQEYVNAGKIEIRDQTNETIEFPAIPDKHYLLEELEKETITTKLEILKEDQSDDDTPAPPPQSLGTPTGCNETMPQQLKGFASPPPCQNDE
jgi:hypothetical protein